MTRVRDCHLVWDWNFFSALLGFRAEIDTQRYRCSLNSTFSMPSVLIRHLFWKFACPSLYSSDFGYHAHATCLMLAWSRPWMNSGRAWKLGNSSFKILHHLLARRTRPKELPVILHEKSRLLWVAPKMTEQCSALALQYFGIKFCLVCKPHSVAFVHNSPPPVCFSSNLSEPISDIIDTCRVWQYFLDAGFRTPP